SYVDERLQNFVELVRTPSRLPASYRAHAERIAELWCDKQEQWPVIHLCGDARGGKRTLAAATCAALSLRLHALRAADIPAASVERETLIRLWQRESLMSRSALLLECDDADEPASLRAAQGFAERVGGPLFVISSLLKTNSAINVARLEINCPD